MPQIIKDFSVYFCVFCGNFPPPTYYQNLINYFTYPNGIT